MADRRIALVAFPDVQILDVTGPLEVFAMADAVHRAAGGGGVYRRELVAPRAGVVTSSGGIRLVADRALASMRGPLDTLLVAGGTGTRAAVSDGRLVRGIQRIARSSRRVAGICTGAFLLAEAGLLEGRRAATHWSAVDALARRHPGLRVEGDPIWVQDGKYYTSAGVTAGIDLALTLVEADLGRELALEVARQLVVFLKRPGGQSQFSAQLASQLAERETLRDVQSYVVEHPGADLSVGQLARRAGMSVRNFARVFTGEVGITPARFVERTRVEAARRLLETSGRSVDEIAHRCGFGSAETLRRSFLRTIEVNPAAYRERFRSRGRRAGLRQPSLRNLRRTS